MAHQLRVPLSAEIKASILVRPNIKGQKRQKKAKKAKKGQKLRTFGVWHINSGCILGIFFAQIFTIKRQVYNHDYMTCILHDPNM